MSKSASPFLLVYSYMLLYSPPFLSLLYLSPALSLPPLLFLARACTNAYLLLPSYHTGSVTPKPRFDAVGAGAETGALLEQARHEFLALRR